MPAILPKKRKVPDPPTAPTAPPPSKPQPTSLGGGDDDDESSAYSTDNDDEVEDEDEEVENEPQPAAPSTGSSTPAPSASKRAKSSLRNGPKAKTKKHVSFPDTPPKWYTNLLTQVIKTKMTEAGEKAPLKAIKETGDDMAKERWADPEERDKMRAHQDRLYGQMFKY